MLYIFKSTAAADLIMLEPNGRRVLQIIGKEAGPKGIIETAQMPAAIAALQAQIAVEETGQPSGGNGGSKGEVPVPLRQRVVPFIDMLQRCQTAGKDIVWGV